MMQDVNCALRNREKEGLSKMHAKGFILDRNVVLNGSVNLTWYGFQSNHEHAYFIAEPHRCWPGLQKLRGTLDASR